MILVIISSLRDFSIITLVEFYINTSLSGFTYYFNMVLSSLPNSCGEDSNLGEGDYYPKKHL